MLAARIQEVFDKGASSVEADFVSKDGTRTPYYFTGLVTELEGRRHLVGVGIDISALRKTEQLLRTANEELGAINRIITTTTTKGINQILEIVLDEALHITGLEGATICLVTHDETLHFAVCRETSEKTIRDLTTNTIGIGECLCGTSARDYKPLILHNREDVLRFSTREATRGEDIRFHAAFPLIVGKKCLGALCAFTRTDKKPSERSLRLLETVTSQIAIVVENAKLYEDLVHHAAVLEERIRERTIGLQEANERLKELDRLKSMFIASMSHELRTPLNSVIGFSSILLKEWAGPLNAEQKENLAIVLRSGKYLLALINDVIDVDVIDVSKIEAGTIETYAEDFDIFDVISEAVTPFKKEIEDKGLVLNVEAAAHHTICTDRRRLLQCILNLISNATKYTEKGTITVTARLVPTHAREGEQRELRQQRDFVEISVADTGIGITDKDIPRLFESFVRLESHLRATVQGTGLGLYLTKKLVTEILKGEITVTSRRGQGSIFAIKIPAMYDG